MRERLYEYIGPEQIRRRSEGAPPGRPIGSLAEIRRWVADHQDSSKPAQLIPATFVVDAEGTLCLADRRSEHVACSGGRPVRSAGEIFFAGDGSRVEEVTNQSTGFCPDPESWGPSPRSSTESGFHIPAASRQR